MHPMLYTIIVFACLGFLEFECFVFAIGGVEDSIRHTIFGFVSLIGAGVILYLSTYFDFVALCVVFSSTILGMLIGTLNLWKYLTNPNYFGPHRDDGGFLFSQYF
jgi:hypothetical protein